jgi:hypothetical protein
MWHPENTTETKPSVKLLKKIKLMKNLLRDFGKIRNRRSSDVIM